MQNEKRNLIILFSVCLLVIVVFGGSLLFGIFGFIKSIVPSQTQNVSFVSAGAPLTVTDEQTFKTELQILQGMQVSLNAFAPITHQQLSWHVSNTNIDKTFKFWPSEEKILDGIGFRFVDMGIDPVDFGTYLHMSGFSGATEAPFMASGEWFTKDNIVCVRSYTSENVDTRNQGPWTHIVMCGDLRKAR